MYLVTLHFHIMRVTQCAGRSCLQSPGSDKEASQASSGCAELGSSVGLIGFISRVGRARRAGFRAAGGVGVYKRSQSRLTRGTALENIPSESLLESLSLSSSELPVVVALDSPLLVLEAESVALAVPGKKVVVMHLAWH